jgi:chemotaxis protein MotB
MAPPAPKEEVEDESWLGTYADAITLLMAFFVLLVSVSKVDLALYEEVAEGISKEVSKNKDRKSPMKELASDATDVVREMTDGKALKVGVDDSGIVLEFDGSAFFLPGSAQLKPEAVTVVASISELVNSPQYLTFNMDLEGHTDDDPISTIQFPSNWELAAARASSVVRTMIDQGTLATRMRVISYGPTRPKEPNRLEDGTPLPENKAANRRVVMRIHQQTFEYSKPKYIPLTSIARDFDENADPNAPAPADTAAPTDATAPEPAK